MGLGTYITAENVRTQRLRGQYMPSNFIIPADTLQAAAAAPAAAGAVAKAVTAVRAKGMHGAYAQNVWTSPPYRNAGMGQASAISSFTTWISAPNSFFPSMSNLIVYGGGGLALYLLMGRKGGRR